MFTVAISFTDHVLPCPLVEDEEMEMSRETDPLFNRQDCELFKLVTDMTRHESDERESFSSSSAKRVPNNDGRTSFSLPRSLFIDHCWSTWMKNIEINLSLNEIVIDIVSLTNISCPWWDSFVFFLFSQHHQGAAKTTYGPMTSLLLGSILAQKRSTTTIIDAVVSLSLCCCCCSCLSDGNRRLLIEEWRRRHHPYIMKISEEIPFFSCSSLFSPFRNPSTRKKSLPPFLPSLPLSLSPLLSSLPSPSVGCHLLFLFIWQYDRVCLFSLPW